GACKRGGRLPSGEIPGASDPAIREDGLRLPNRIAPVQDSGDSARLGLHRRVERRRRYSRHLRLDAALQAEEGLIPRPAASVPLQAEQPPAARLRGPEMTIIQFTGF